MVSIVIKEAAAATTVEERVGVTAERLQTCASSPLPLWYYIVQKGKGIVLHLFFFSQNYNVRAAIIFSVTDDYDSVSSL